MNAQNGPDDSDVLSEQEEEELLALLRAGLRSLPDAKNPADEVAPPSVIDGALWVHDWHNLDAELALLTFDSESNPELAGVRSASSLRQLRFDSDGFEIVIDIEPNETTVSLTGSISPISPGEVEIVVGGMVHRGSIDELGTFVIDNVDNGTALAFVKTDEHTIRLGSFEL